MQPWVDVSTLLGPKWLVRRRLETILIDVDRRPEFGFADREEVVGREGGDRGYRSPSRSSGSRSRSRARATNPATSARRPEPSRY
jgi:hypothetical protein